MESKEDYAELGCEEFPDEFQCCVCLDIMYKPVVLGCGHISCFWCVFKVIITSRESHCPVCRSRFNHFPRIFKLLHFLLLKLYPSAYERRERQVAGSKENQEHAGEHSRVPTDVYSSWWSSPPFNGPQVHHGFGCDYCGITPIIGERCRCKDCVEKIGFDLCQGCYGSSSKRPGLFNQQHTQDHKFVVAEPHYLRNLILSLGADEYERFDTGVINRFSI